MARYLKTVEQLKNEVNDFILNHVIFKEQAVVQLGHIINLAVRSCPRPTQGTVRKNIVGGAMKDHCNVTMEKCTDGDKTFNKINIKVKNDA